MPMFATMFSQRGNLRTGELFGLPLGERRAHILMAAKSENTMAMQALVASVGVGVWAIVTITKCRLFR